MMWQPRETTVGRDHQVLRVIIGPAAIAQMHRIGDQDVGAADVSEALAELHEVAVQLRGGGCFSRASPSRSRISRRTSRRLMRIRPAWKSRRDDELIDGGEDHGARRRRRHHQPQARLRCMKQASSQRRVADRAGCRRSGRSDDDRDQVMPR